MDKSIQEGVRLYRNGLYKRAMEAFLEADLDPMEDNELSYYLGLVSVQLGALRDAETYLRHAVSLENNLVRLYQIRMVLAYVYATREEPGKAQVHLDHLIDSGYESVQVYCVYGYTCWQQGREELAFEYLRKAVLLDPENPTALNSLGYLLAEQNKELDNALRYCRKAVSHEPGNSLYLDSLGWAYFRNGDLDDAFSILKKAIELDEENPEIRDHLRTVMSARERSAT